MCKFMGDDSVTTWGSQITCLRLRADTVGGTPQFVAFDGTSIWVANAGNATITRLSRT